MATPAQHLPGCYRNICCEPGESLPGYLLRVAESNSYQGIRDLLRQATIKSTRQTRVQVLKLYADEAGLAHLGRMTVGDPQHLTRFAAQPLSDVTANTPGEALYMQQRRVDIDALLPLRAAVCPRCLLDYGYAREEWDLAPVTVCVEHESLLVDQCTSCNAPITWDRPYLFHCEECAADLRAIESARVQPQVVAIATHLQVLAPFRLQDHKGRIFVIDWEEMFHLLKVLLLPDSFWCAGEFPPSFVTDTTLTQRHRVIELLAPSLAGATYDIEKLRSKAAHALAPLEALPIRGAKEDIGVRYLVAEAGLSQELAAALCGREESGEAPTAAEVFGGRPPSLRSHAAIARFLNANVTDVCRLIQLGVIAPRVKGDIGHDVDHLLNARRFLDSLVGLEGLSKLVGVRAGEADLHAYGLFPPWNSESPSDFRVMPERLIELQRRLAVRWFESTEPHNARTLGSLAESHTDPFEFVSRVTQHIIMGTLKSFRWKPPFRWVDIEVCLADLQSLQT